MQVRARTAKPGSVAGLSGLCHEIVYGASANRSCRWDNSNAFRPGYSPEDRAEDHDTGQGYEDITGDPRADLNQGGVSCSDEQITTPV